MTTDHHDPKLLVGLDAPDDAAVYQIAPDVAIVQTVDFFTPIVDDAYSWGRIAAANALSDVYAMGASPKTALNLVGWPRDLGFELLGAVIEGAGDACHEAGVAVVGGHSIDDPEPKFGLSVTGTVHPDRIVTKTGATSGCELVLTKPLGMGIISSGIKAGKTTEETEQRAIRIMSALNRSACEAMVEVGAEAATDVTGFGLVGHLLQMLDGRLDADLHYSSIPLLEDAVGLAAAGVFPEGSRRNRAAGEGRVRAAGVGEAPLALLYDAQTSGGLLIAVAPEKVDRLMRSLSERGVEDAARIGELKSGVGRVRVG
ncbi:MAG: selenide, water dikinase SelD [Actinomycetota bacterium]|nr:selenide, water dikinase SelD [Actinomycetota bacterium]